MGIDADLEPGGIVAGPRAGETVFSLEATDAVPATPREPLLPHGLDVLRFVLAGDAELHHAGERAGWMWRRHG